MILVAFATALLVITAGCATPAQTIGLVAGVTAFGGQAPTHELQQVYYLGIFDPQEQLPPAIYRVTVRGQASLISFIRFASGWVPAEAVDTLTSRVEMNLQTGTITLSKESDDKLAAALSAGRRQVLFGPEGFREAPRNHRLVIVMGSDASEYFDTIGSIYRTLYSATSLQDLLLDLQTARLEREKLERLQEKP